MQTKATDRLQERKPARLMACSHTDYPAYIRCVTYLWVCALLVALASCSPATTPTSTATALVKLQPTANPTARPTSTSTPTATLQPTPTSTMVPTPIPPTLEPLFHTVESGEWPELIAEKYGISLNELLSANGLDSDAVLSVGQTLLIPTPPPTAVPTTILPPAEATTAPATEVTLTPTVTSEPLFYTVTSGDYPEAIAEAFGVDLGDFLAANDLERNSVLQVGQKVIIPTATPEPPVNPASQHTATPEPTSEWVYVDITHVVARGETIETIAEFYGVSWETIADANGIGKNSVLQIGQELTIPGVAVEAASIPTPEEAATWTPTPEPNGATGEAPAAQEPTPTPGVVTYTVSNGDYLELIAEHFGISAEELANANNITVDSVIHVGQELIIPIQATSVPTQVPTSTPTVKPQRASPTPRPTVKKPADLTYQQPVLLAPANNTVFAGEEAAILLNWKSVGILSKNEWYQVRIWTTTEQQEPDIYYTKSTSWRPQIGFYNEENAPYTIRWQVQVVRVGKSREEYLAKSPSSTTYTFYWR